MQLELSKIRIDGGTQPRAQLDFFIVDDYADAMATGAQFPPVEVVYDGSNYWLVDGFHRLNAARQLGLADIAATVTPGTLQDAQWQSYGVNQTHGLRRTNDDKRRAVEAALKHPKAQQLSDNQIASHCGVSQPFVSKLRPSYNDYKIDDTPRTVTRNGSTYQMNTANIGKQSNGHAAPPGYPAPKTTDCISTCDVCGEIYDNSSFNNCPYCYRKQNNLYGWVDKLPGRVNGEFKIEPAQTNSNRPHVSYNTGENEWYTPIEFIDAARAVMGAIDLDPASSVAANKTVMAETFYTIETDGLEQDWRGRVWMNPPYSKDLIAQFCEKFTSEYQYGNITQAITLTNNATETRWFQMMLGKCSAACFPQGRVKFIDTNGDATGAPLQGQAILYFGDNVPDFINCFCKFGVVLYAK